MQDSYLFDEYATLQKLGFIGEDVEFDEWLCRHDGLF